MIDRDGGKGSFVGAAILTGLALVAGQAQAAVPPDIEAQLIKIGRIVDPACTAKLYRPLMPANDIRSNAKPLYPGIAIDRDVSFGPNPKDVADVFTADKGPEARTVLIYVAGGAGNKLELQDQEANAFYDNIMRWATRNGMVGVSMQRHQNPEWDGGAKDVSKLIQWVQTNIARYHGNPERVFIWAHSAANNPVGTYIGHPEVYGPKGVGLKGVIFMSPAQFDIAPFEVPANGNAPNANPFAGSGVTCGAGDPTSTAGALPGKVAGEPGGPDPAGAGPGRGPGGRPPVDPATQLARSSLPALQKTPVKILVANGELDIGTAGTPDGLMPFAHALKEALCKAGPERCPTVLLPKGHSHMSLVFSIDTPDTSVSEPVLAWISSVK